MGNYNNYLKSSHWKQTRKAKLESVDGTCEGCGGDATQVHHTTYERLGDELLSDLEALCYTCHKDRHPNKDWYSKDAWTEFIEKQCPMCPSTMLTCHHYITYYGKHRMYQQCIECGYDLNISEVFGNVTDGWLRDTPDFDKDDKENTNNKTDYVTKGVCTICDRQLSGIEGLLQHTIDVHPNLKVWAESRKQLRRKHKGDNNKPTKKRSTPPTVVA